MDPASKPKPQEMPPGAATLAAETPATLASGARAVLRPPRNGGRVGVVCLHPWGPLGGSLDDPHVVLVARMFGEAGCATARVQFRSGIGWGGGSARRRAESSSRRSRQRRGKQDLNRRTVAASRPRRRRCDPSTEHAAAAVAALHGISTRHHAAVLRPVGDIYT